MSLSLIINYFQEFNIISICSRLVLAVILGGLIGLDRERRTRSAGFRTHSLVALGATLVMLIGNYIYLHFDQSGDIARLGAQVVSGIGFLGAGAIITSGSQKVRGLTTAAALWTCACIGLALGVGFYSGAFATCIISLLLLRVLRIVDKKYRDISHFVDIYLEVYKSEDANNFIDFLKHQNIKIVSFDSTNPKVTTSELGLRITVVLDKLPSDVLINLISELDYVNFTHKVYV